jgi:hypothetical protein
MEWGTKMDSKLRESFRETGELVTELTAKAGEAERAGVSRRSFVTSALLATGATVLGSAAVAKAAGRPAFSKSTVARTCSCSEKRIFSIAATAELLATTMYYRALALPTDLPDVNSIANRNYFQAALTEEYLHYELLTSLGGAPLANSFFFPGTMFTNETTFFNTFNALETAFVAAYLAAAREFSGAVSSVITTANPVLIGAAVQIAAVEGEHRVLGRVAAGINPPNDRYLESGEFACVEDAATALHPFLTGGSGFSGPFHVPSRSEVNSAASPYGFSFFPPEPVA